MATVRWYSIGIQNGSTSVSKSDDFCKAQSFITTSMSIASFLWTSFIAIYLFICVWFSRVVDLSGVTFIFVHVVAWGIPGHFQVMKNMIIKKSRPSYNVNKQVHSGCLKKRSGQFLWNQISAGLRREDELFCFTWLILYCLRMWGTLRFFLDIAKFNHGTTEFVLLILQSYGDSAHAFWNFIYFVFVIKLFVLMYGAVII
ncbi:uncharacterized protein LOC134692253 [Mytilus trossulus]|uniref:uncharacterized protein LOC134692253 n=1 Tax=Mytilus trossulus TaxID=6551 RepID=UPI0030060F23